MAQIIRLKRSNTANGKPTTSDLATGELAINVNDGKVFLRKSGSDSGGLSQLVQFQHQLFKVMVLH